MAPKMQASGATVQNRFDKSRPRGHRSQSTIAHDSKGISAEVAQVAESTLVVLL